MAVEKPLAGGLTPALGSSQPRLHAPTPLTHTCTPSTWFLFCSPFHFLLFSKEQQQPWSCSFLWFNAKVCDLRQMKKLLFFFFSCKLAGTAQMRLLQWKWNRQSKRGGWHKWLKQKTLCLLVEDQANLVGTNAFLYISYILTQSP